MASSRSGKAVSQNLKPPDATRLYDAALTYLARYTTTKAGMARVLARKIERWGRLNENTDPAVLGAATAAIPAIIKRLSDEKLLDDDAFAASRARRLGRGGKSRRAALAHLASKGVDARTAREAIADDPEHELAAACVYLRRRQAGPFGDAAELKTLGALARAGFSRETSRRALALSRDEAELRIKMLQRDG